MLRISSEIWRIPTHRSIIEATSYSHFYFSLSIQ
jgi:hypothetical protein